MKSDLSDALLEGFNLLIKEALRPFTLQFYKDRNGEFANCIGLAEYTIEHWCDSVKVSETYLGFRTYPYRHILDEYLKQNECKNHDTAEKLSKWQKMLERKEIPDELQIMTHTACCI
ncbi:MAG: hypothetical protein ACK5XN_08425 [Bacteroidota bacterium]